MLNDIKVKISFQFFILHKKLINNYQEKNETKPI